MNDDPVKGVGVDVDVNRAVGEEDLIVSLHDAVHGAREMGARHHLALTVGGYPPPTSPLVWSEIANSVLGGGGFPPSLPSPTEAAGSRLGTPFALPALTGVGLPTHGPSPPSFGWKTPGTDMVTSVGGC